MGRVCNELESGSGITYTVVMYYYYYLLQLSCHCVPVVLTLVQTKQIRINIKEGKVIPLQARCGPEGG